MFCKEVQIQNYKAIKEMQLTFSPGVNLLIGDNGVGKTSVLDALSVALAGFLAKLKGVPVSGIRQSDIRMETAPGVIRYMTPTTVACTATIDGRDFRWARTRDGESSAYKTKLSSPEIASYAVKLANDATCKLPLLGYVRTVRAARTKRGDYTAVSKKFNDRRCGYMGCLEGTLDINGIKEWCLQMEMAAFQRGGPIPAYEAFKGAVAEVMQKMSALQKPPTIAYSKLFEDIVYTEGESLLPISYLSAGYQSLLWMTMDLARRLALLDPGHCDCHQATGIVLIDELDMHLHPKWQWNALTALQEVFPKLQFIIATHSPILISSCERGRLIRLDPAQNVTYLEGAFGYSITDVLELRQGALGVPQEIRVLADRFEDALNLGDHARARAILQEMKARYGEDNTQVRSAMLDLELGDPDGPGQE